MGKKLLIVNTYANLWSTGRIAAEIGEIAVKHGWQCYFAYASESNLCSCEEIRINKSVISYIIHTYLFSRILNLKGFGSWIETKLFIRKIKKIAPDIIHLHNIHQNFLNLPLLFSFLKKAGIPVIWTLHDCWAVTGGRRRKGKSSCFPLHGKLVALTYLVQIPVVYPRLIEGRHVVHNGAGGGKHLKGQRAPAALPQTHSQQEQRL